MTLSDSDGTSFLITEKDEFVKKYITYDASERMEYVYTVRTGAADGEPCSVTQYTYDGTSTRTVKMKESASTWDSSWDI